MTVISALCTSPLGAIPVTMTLYVPNGVFADAAGGGGALLFPQPRTPNNTLIAITLSNSRPSLRLFGSKQISSIPTLTPPPRVHGQFLPPSAFDIVVAFVVAAFTVNVAVVTAAPPTAIDATEVLHVIDVGAAHASVTGPLNPFNGIRFTVAVPVLPAAIVKFGVCDCSVKSVLSSDTVSVLLAEDAYTMSPE